MIHGEKIGFSYEFDGSPVQALKEISLSVGKGELVAVLGCNGSGKSTLVKHFNALLPLQQGELSVAGINVREEEDVWRLRHLCGMVFQNPDNQFVSSVVEEDIAFSIMNYEVPEREIAGKVAEALHVVGMDGMEKRAPQTLSGGQKQRVALAGVLALSPEILIFDEATSMLDPQGRREVLDVIEKQHRAGKTILMITHYVEEAMMADKILLIADGSVLACGTPRGILTDSRLLGQAGLLPPVPVRLYEDLKRQGIMLANCPLTEKELVDELCRL